MCASDPADETILLCFCCCADVPCKGRNEEKPYLADHKAVIKEPKEFKEHIKEFKEPKEIKEIREGGPGFRGQGGQMSVEERLANIESMLGSGGQHFIPSSMRAQIWVEGVEQ